MLYCCEIACFYTDIYVVATKDSIHAGVRWYSQGEIDADSYGRISRVKHLVKLQ